MRLVHTSDWHLGHTLHDVSREHEHARFLSWLIDVIEEEQADALLVTGDVFETANPSAAALATWYRFVADVHARCPALDVVVIGGNHDSAARLDAAEPLMRQLRTHVVGGLPRRADGTLDLERLVVPIHRRGGGIGAWVAAVPFLRPMDLPPDGDLIGGVRGIYDEVVEACRKKRKKGQALIALGHCYMVGGEVSELSERKVLGGNQHALPGDIFPDDVAYVALGHLHLAQRVGGRERIRYAGSPIPLSLSEAGYAHQVLVAELDGARLVGVRERRVPRAVEMLAVGPGSVDEVLAEIAALGELFPGAAEETRPYLHVQVALAAPEPGLRRRIEEALEGKAPRLMKLSVAWSGDGAVMADGEHADLREVRPEQVFERLWRSRHEAGPPPEYVAMFHELLDEAHAGGGA